MVTLELAIWLAGLHARLFALAMLSSEHNGTRFGSKNSPKKQWYWTTTAAFHEDSSCRIKEWYERRGEKQWRGRKETTEKGVRLGEEWLELWPCYEQQGGFIRLFSRLCHFVTFTLSLLSLLRGTKFMLWLIRDTSIPQTRTCVHSHTVSCVLCDVSTTWIFCLYSVLNIKNVDEQSFDNVTPSSNMSRATVVSVVNPRMFCLWCQ